MDISSLGATSIKFRFRHAIFVVDPGEFGSKVECDAIILLNVEKSDLRKVTNYRIVVNGPGEYEVNKVKIIGIKIDKGIVYNILADGLGIVLGKTNEVSKMKEEINSPCQIVVLNVEDNLNQTIITGLEPKVVILYGDNKEKGAMILGKENLTPVKKFTITKDGLPQELQVVALG